MLGSALAVDTDESSVMVHVHGFHSYPARMHPLTACRLVLALARDRGPVFDPFLGSGTVLAEARLRGRRALGVDANPLAIELAWLKTRGFDEASLHRLLQSGDDVRAHAEERRGKRAGPSEPYGPEDREAFAPHVLLELDGLRDGIRRVRDRDERRALALVLSSLLTKLARRAGDTSPASVAKRLPPGRALHLFTYKLEEVLDRLALYASLLPPDAPPTEPRVGDARRLSHVAAGSVGLVVGSPPYPGVYDYHAHHAMRLRWLGLPADRFERDEIGARRRLTPLAPEAALATWEHDLGRVLGEIARVLAPGGRAALLLGDSALGRRPVSALEVVARLAPRVGLALRARASQERPHFHVQTREAFVRQPRREHLLLLGHG